MGLHFANYINADPRLSKYFRKFRPNWSQQKRVFVLVPVWSISAICKRLLQLDHRSRWELGHLQNTDQYGSLENNLYRYRRRGIEEIGALSINFAMKLSFKMGNSRSLFRSFLSRF